MKLNPDCIRDVLLYLEENLTVDYTTRTFSKIRVENMIEPFLMLHTSYEANEVLYSIYNLQQIGYIDGRFPNAGNQKMMVCEIENITWNGHQFLNTIRSQPIWEATKSGAAKLGITSLHALSTIAMQVSNAIITHPEVINNIVSGIKF